MKILLSLFLLGIIGVTSAKSVNKFIIFGDSLSDQGNLYEYTQHKIPASPPYYSGRFSDGPVWVEHLVGSYFPSQDPSNYIHDYAFGGAGVENEKSDALFTLDQEVQTYLSANGDKVDPSNLFFMWIGANNYLGGPKDLAKEIEKVNYGIVYQLERLAKAGAKQIAVLNLPNLGKIPLARVFNLEDKLAQVTLKHNKLLQEKVNDLEKLYPDIQWLYFDIAQIFEDAMTNPAFYGFTNVTEACYKNITERDRAVHQSIIRYSVGSPSRSKSALDCSGHLFFDLLHPTVQAHRLVSENMHNFLTKAGIILE